MNLLAILAIGGFSIVCMFLFSLVFWIGDGVFGLMTPPETSYQLEIRSSKRMR